MATDGARLSAAGLSAAQLESAVGVDDQGRSKIASKECLTRDDYPLGADGAGADGMFAVLAGNVGRGSAATDAVLSSRLQMLYELFGERLSPDFSARAPRPRTTCWRPGSRSAPRIRAPVCSADAGQARVLAECGRLAARHASAALALIRLDACMGALSAVAEVRDCAQPDAAAADASDVAERLVHKALGYAVPGEQDAEAGKRAAAARRAYAIGRWWPTAQRLALLSPEGAARAEAALGPVLGVFWRAIQDGASLDHLAGPGPGQATTDAELSAALRDVLEGTRANRYVFDALLAGSDQVVLPAGATPPASDTLLIGEPRLQLLADALQIDVDRAETLARPTIWPVCSRTAPPIRCRPSWCSTGG